VHIPGSQETRKPGSYIDRRNNIVLSDAWKIYFSTFIPEQVCVSCTQELSDTAYAQSISKVEQLRIEFQLYYSGLRAGKWVSTAEYCFAHSCNIQIAA